VEEVNVGTAEEPEFSWTDMRATIGRALGRHSAKRSVFMGSVTQIEAGRWVAFPTLEGEPRSYPTMEAAMKAAEAGAAEMVRAMDAAPTEEPPEELVTLGIPSVGV
jgi:hypothetical protein